MVEQLRQCIRTCLDCADICAATGTMAVRRTGSNVEVLRAVLEACGRCGEECRSHADHHEHCRICAKACKRCASACQEALQDVQ